MSQHRNNDLDSGPHSRAFYGLGTRVLLCAYGAQDACMRALGQARDACRRYEALFSRTDASSDISRLNAAKGKAVSISASTYDMLEHALRYCAESEGTFDITVGPVLALWDFANGIVPCAEKLAKAAEHVDWRNLKLQKAQDRTALCSARLADPLASVDAGGIAKGWIADNLCALLRTQAGVTGGFVNLGGNVAVFGSKPNGDPWRIGVRDPREPNRSATTLVLSKGSAVTSGTYERSFEKNGSLFHHILDPRCGMPVRTDLASATVVADRSLDAEGYSTTLLALGCERALAFARRKPVIKQAVLIDNAGTVRLLYE